MIGKFYSAKIEFKKCRITKQGSLSWLENWPDWKNISFQSQVTKAVSQVHSIITVQVVKTPLNQH